MFPENMTFDAFCMQFNSEHACAEALFQARWPDGFRCPDCSRTQYYLIHTRRLPLYECRFCRLQTSIISGTIMEGSTTPLTRWFQAFYLISQPLGISAARLSRVIQVTYKTAWLIARKIRHAMQQADRSEPLTGIVRVQPIHYGYEDFADASQPLLIGSSMEDNEPQHVKIKQPNPSHVYNETRWLKKSAGVAFKCEHTNSEFVNVSYRKVHFALQRIKMDASSWLNNTFHGIGAKHLQAYLDEFCFRLNLKIRSTPVFGQLLNWCTRTLPQTYKALTRDIPVLPVPWADMDSKAKWKGKHLSAWSGS